jgi:hypothetical protein
MTEVVTLRLSRLLFFAPFGKELYKFDQWNNVGSHFWEDETDVSELG